MRNWLFVATLGVLCTSPVSGQDISVPAVTTASPGGYANPLKLDTDRYKQQQKAKQAAPKQYPGCSVDAMPAADKRRIDTEYKRLALTQGQPAAQRWARQEGLRFHQKLVAQGICPTGKASSAPRTASGNAGERKATGIGKKGKCTKTVMQPRNVANLGGGAMSMIWVPVCVD